MWMCYAEKHWPEAVDPVSAAKRLSEEFSALARDAYRQINGLGVTDDERTDYQHLERNYSKGSSLCKMFVYKKTLCAPCLVYKLEKLKLECFAKEIRYFLTVGVNENIPDQHNGEEEEEEEEDGNDYEESIYKKCRRCGDDVE